LDPERFLALKYCNFKTNPEKDKFALKANISALWMRYAASKRKNSFLFLGTNKDFFLKINQFFLRRRKKMNKRGAIF
jgi:hypothetical protein